MGRDRLVMPGGVGEVPATQDKDKDRRDVGGNGGSGIPPTPRHPFIEGLLKTLPEPETEWPAAARAKWLQTAANIFDLIYKGDGGITVTSAI